METKTGDEREQEFQVPGTEFSITQVLLDAWRYERLRWSSVQRLIGYWEPHPPNLGSPQAVQTPSNRDPVFPSTDRPDGCLPTAAQATGTNSALSPAFLGAEPPTAARAVDVNDFRACWLAMADRQSRVQLTNHYGISELQGLRIVGDTWASQVPVAAIYERIGLLVATQLPCNLEFSHGVTRRVRCGRLSGFIFESESMILSGHDWSSSFKLSEIDTTWLVTQPGSGRLESSIELYGRDGLAIMRLYGTSEPQENAVWHDLLGTLPTVHN